MGRYRVVKSDHISAILAHEPESDAAQVIEIRHPQSPGLALPDDFAEGNWYYVSASFSRTDAPILSPITPLPNTVENERQIGEIAQGRLEQATGPVSGVASEAPAEEKPKVKKAAAKPKAKASKKS